MSDEARPWTVEDLLRAHPWPAVAEAARGGKRPLEWLWRFDLPVAPDDLWRVVSDTSRMNRALGVSEMTFEDRGGARWGRSRAAGVDQEWTEVPWTWVAGQWLESVRLYTRGFTTVVFAVYHLQPLSTGTRMYVYFGAVPRGLLAAAALRVGFRAIGQAYATILPRLAAQLGKARPAALVVAPPALPEGARARLDAIGRALVEQGLDATAVKQLVEWIATGDDQDLYRIQVRERARAWGLDEDALLRVALHATRSGLLQLSWDVLCPHCRGVTGEASALGGVASQAECKVCGIDFGTGAAEAVEITFHVHPSIRAVTKRQFCSAEPATKEHIRVQRWVPAGCEEVVTPRLAAGLWRTRIQGEKRYGLLEVGAGPGSSAQELVWRATEEPRQLTVEAVAADSSLGAGTPRPLAQEALGLTKPAGDGGAPCRSSLGSLALRLVNDSAEGRTFIVEASQWTDVALRPGKLLSFPEFRDLFSEEYLADDVQLAVGEQTILFTDLVDSTAMYVDLGDPGAFVAVKRHFATVFAGIKGHRGALVKTIGDAAMGAFCDPLDAVRAAQAIQRGFGPGSEVRVRVSVHTGPCLAVKLDADIDYFGNTVNLAAKLQALVGAGQVVISEATRAAPGVAAWLASEGVVAEEVRLEHRAYPAPVVARRWSPAAS